MPSGLHEYFKRPIPDLTEQRNTIGSFRDVPIDTEDPLHDEGYVDLREFGIAGINHYHRVDNPPYFQQVPGSIPQLYARLTVAKKLMEINTRLEALGLELFVFDAGRPQAVQGFMHDVWVPDYLREQNPNLSEEDARTQAGLYWSRPAASDDDVNPLGPPPHSTLAAVDLTIRQKRPDDQQHLYMGSIFDEANEVSWPDHFEKPRGATDVVSMSDAVAMRNRRLLYWVMMDGDFATYPREWWHVSHKDQQWAKTMGQPKARYANKKMV